MGLEIDRIQKLPELKIGDIKNDIQSCKLRVISSRDRFAYAIEIEYIDEIRRICHGNYGRRDDCLRCSS